jgi:hypothetical protein
MPVTYPRPFPAPLAGMSGWFAEVRFELQRTQSMVQTAGGAAATVTWAEPVWGARFVTRPLTAAGMDVWAAWLDSLKGGAQLFLGTDPDKAFPRAYRQSGWTGLTRATFSSGAPAFDGTTTVQAIDATRELLTIGSTGAATNQAQALPANLILGVGDMLDVDRTGGRRSVHRIVNIELATNASGRAQVQVEPAIRPDTATGATVRLSGWAARMRVIARDDAPKMANRKVRPQIVAFTALEDLVA